jgi:uracil phosphoribosyltransferase
VQHFTVQGEHKKTSHFQIDTDNKGYRKEVQPLFSILLYKVSTKVLYTFNMIHKTTKELQGSALVKNKSVTTSLLWASNFKN